MYWLADRWCEPDVTRLKDRLDLSELERWKAHFRFRKDLNEDEWVPLAQREMTLADVRAKAAQTATEMQYVFREAKCQRTSAT
jgi:hypothetical protein